MSRVTSYDQLRLAKLDFLNDTNFKILVRKFLPFATVLSLAIFFVHSSSIRTKGEAWLSCIYFVRTSAVCINCSHWSCVIFFLQVICQSFYGCLSKTRIVSGSEDRLYSFSFVLLAKMNNGFLYSRYLTHYILFQPWRLVKLLQNFSHIFIICHW